MKAAPGSIRSRSRACLRPIRFRSCRRCSRAMPTKLPSSPLPAGRRPATVVVKILSPDIVHKSEVGGVRLNLTSERAVREATSDILGRARAQQARRPHHRRHHPSDDPAAEGARADRRDRR